LKLDKRYSSGLTLLSSYVLSKMFATADTAVISDRIVMDHYNRKLDKALSGDDQTHILRQAFSYELPVGTGKRWNLSGVADKFLGGWGFAGFLEYGSGIPMSVGSGVGSVPGGAGNRVFINSYEGWRAPVSGDKFDPFKDVWWDKSQFSLDANGRQMTPTELLYAGFGNATRLNPKARRAWNLEENVALSKNVNITERVRFTLRVEAFNLFNRVRWSAPDNTWTSANFGVIRGQDNNPRRMQFGAKFTF
jgi:hypothetical protein